MIQVSECQSVVCTTAGESHRVMCKSKSEIFLRKNDLHKDKAT